MLNNTVLYFHINMEKGEVFYVGIGNKTRPHSKRDRTKFWNNIVNKYMYDIIIEEEGLTWDEACELEKYWIKRIGRRDLGLGPLVNMTDGGDGATGRTHSEETKNKIRLANLCKIVTEETKLKIRLSAIGRTISEETKEKISNSTKGKPKSSEHKLKISLNSIGKPPTKGNTGKKRSIETNLLINIAKQRNKKLKTA